ncbi:MAG: DUF2911 domain-containing protein [Bacteroidota bacterium]
MNSIFLKSLLLLSSLLIFGSNTEAQIGRLPLSPRQKIEQKIARTDITIVYSRPSAKGRKIFGDLVKFGTYWRTGANENTTIEFSEAVYIGGKKVESGKYSILSIPAKSSWEFLLYADTDNWDVPEKVEEEKIVAQISVEPQSLSDHVENFTISIDNFTNYQCELTIKWAKTQISVPIDLNTRELMDAVILEELSGPDYGDYYLAATYEFESGKNYERGLKWIDKAIELTEEIGWWDYRIKAYLLMGLAQKEAAKEIAQKGMELAKKADHSFGMREFQSILRSLE